MLEIDVEQRQLRLLLKGPIFAILNYDQQNTELDDELRDNFSYFSFKLNVVTPHLNHLIGTVQMRGHNICQGIS